jgi:hypothetical protein
MAYSGLGTGTTIDPYQITTVSQLKETGVLAYAGCYCRVMNDLDLSSESAFSMLVYSYFDGGGHTLSGIPCSGTGFSIKSNSSFHDVKLKWTSVNIQSNGASVFNITEDLSNAVITNIEIHNDIIDSTAYMNLMSYGQVLGATCTVNNITIDGCFRYLFQKVYGTISNIKVLNSYCGISRLVEQMYSTTIVELFQYIKPVTNSTDSYTCHLTQTMPSGAIFRKGILDIGKTKSSTTYGAIDGFASSSGAIIQDLCIIGEIDSPNNNYVFPIVSMTFSASYNTIQNVFFYGNITTPNYTARNTVMAPWNCQISNSYYNKDVLTGISGFNKTGQTGLTTAQCQDSSLFTGWDFSTIWKIGAGHPELISVPRCTLFLRPGTNISIDSPVRSSSQTAQVSLVTNATSGFGVELISESGSIVFSKDNSASFLASQLLPEDQVYTLIGYVYVEGTRVDVTRTTYDHFYRDSAVASLTPITASKYSPLTDAVNQGNYIHGTCIYGDYLYGTTRNVLSGSPSQNGVLYRAPVEDVSNFTLIPIYLDENSTKSYTVDSLVAIGDKLFTSSQHSDGYTRIIVFDTKILDYQVYKVNGTNFYGGPSCTDGEYLYIYVGSDRVYKINPSIFNSSTKFNVGGFWDIGSTFTLLTYHYTYQALPHTMVVDSQHLYVGCGTGTVFSGYEVQKINKSDMSLVSYVKTPKMTDDMCQTDTHLFLGLELLMGASQSVYGYGWGTCAIRKSDLRLTAIPLLHKTDLPSDASYASLIFGNYMINLKTNTYIYAIDISDPDSWSESEDRGLRTMKAYQIYRPNLMPLSSPINEIFLNDAGKFIGFCWNSPSVVVELDLTGLNYFSKPTVESATAAVIDNKSVSLSGSILNSGGKKSTECGFLVGKDSNLLDATVYPAESLSSNFITLIGAIEDPGTYFWRAYATNQEGVGYGAIKSFIIESNYSKPGTPSIISHIVNCEIELTWTAPADSGGTPIIGYKIERNPGNGWVVVTLNTHSTETSYVDMAVPGTYNYRISAITSFDTSDPSTAYEVVASSGGQNSGRYKIYLGSREVSVL